MNYYFTSVFPNLQAEAAVAAAGSAEKLTIPIPDGVEKPVHPKIDKIAQEITALNLIEVAELSDLLKKRLNLPDAPVMPVGGFAAAPKADEVHYLIYLKPNLQLKFFNSIQEINFTYYFFAILIHDIIAG